MRTLSAWMFELLFVSLTGAAGLGLFPEKIVVAHSYDHANPITLTCHTNFEGTVTWKVNGVEEDFEDNIQQDGQNLIISEWGEPDLGEYSCWSGGKRLSSTYLLLESDVEEEFHSHLHCWAKSYDCDFSCEWTSAASAVRLGLGADCIDGGESCQWVYKHERALTGGFQFNLSHSILPYAEESTMLDVTAEVITKFTVIRKTTRFYLRDIVRPDQPQIVRYKKVEGQRLHVTIEPPSSWSKPHSFFGLEHQIEYVYRNDGKHGFSSSALIPESISMLRVRCRDSLVHSAWSEWTPWENVH